MALLWADGFDHYGTTANLDLNYTVQSNVSLNTNVGSPRTGLGCVSLTRNLFQWNFPSLSTTNTIIISVALKMSQSPFSNRTYGIRFGNVEFSIYNDGGINIFVNGAKVFVTEAGTFPFNSWNSFQFKIFFDAATGFVQLRKNGSNDDIALIQNVNTGAVPSLIEFGNYGGFPVGTFYIDDFVFMDDSGSFDNDFIGDPRCRTRMMNANGPTQDFTSLSGAPAYSELSHVPPDESTWAIQSDTVGNISNFTADPLPSNTSFCAGIFMMAQVSKSDTSICEMEMGIVSNGVLSPVVPINPGTTGAYVYGAVESDPNTGGYFTKEAANAAMWQIERTA